MIRRATLFLISLCLLATASTSASASTPVKEYVFAELVFNSEVKRPAGQHFDVAERARFGRLSYIAPLSFMDELQETGSEAVLGGSAPAPTPTWLAGRTRIWIPCWGKLAPRG